MLRIARLAPSLLPDLADTLIHFLHGRFNDDGGARDRVGRSDLYYTVFTLDGLTALGADIPSGDTDWLPTRFRRRRGAGFCPSCLSGAGCRAAMPRDSLG